MTDIGTLTAHIGLDTKDLEKGHARSQAIMGQLGSGAGGLSSQFGGLTATIGKVGAALGLAFGASQAIKFLKDSVVAGMESQQAWNDLTAAITRHGGSYATIGAQIELFASGVQRSFGISDEAVAQSIQRFVDYGMSTTTAMDMTRRAIDLSVGAHVDLDQAVKAIARGYAGNTMLLQRLTGVTEEAATGTEKFENVMARLNKMFGGAAAAQVGGYALKVHTLKESFSEASEAFGKLLLKTGEATGLANVLDRLASGAFNIAQQLDALHTTSGRIAELRANLAALDTLQGRAGTTVGFGTPINDAVKIFAAQIGVSVSDVETFRKKLQGELEMLLALGRFGKLAAGGWQGVPFVVPEDITNLRESMLRSGIGPVGPTTSIEEGELIKTRLKEDADAVKAANAELLRQAEERGWIGKTVFEAATKWIPPEDEFTGRFKAQQDAIMEILQGENLSAKMREYYATELQNAGGADIEATRQTMIGQGVSPGAANAVAANRLRELNRVVKELGTRSPETQRRYNELMLGMQDATSRAMDGIVQQFLRGRVALADIFRAMASDFITLFIHEITMRIGAKIAGAILGFALGGPAGAAVGTITGPAFGGSEFGKLVPPSDYLGRLAPAPESSVLVITPPMSVSQAWIRGVVAPELKRLGMNGVRI